MGKRGTRRADHGDLDRVSSAILSRHLIERRVTAHLAGEIDVSSFLDLKNKSWEAPGRALARAGVPIDSISLQLAADFEYILVQCYEGDRPAAKIAVAEAGKTASMAYTLLDLGMGREARDMLRERDGAKHKGLE